MLERAVMRWSPLLVLCVACGSPWVDPEIDRGIDDAGAGAVLADAGAVSQDAGVVFFPSDGRDRGSAGLSCWSILGEGHSRGDGIYWVDPAGNGEAFRVYCDMTQDGGGWTLLLKIDGEQDTFLYSSPLWTNREVLNPNSTNMDLVEMKSEAALSMPVAEFRIGFQEPDHATRFLHIGMKEEKPLRMYFFYGRFQSTEAGRDAWKNLMVSGSLQLNCNREGFNNGNRLRIGILGNQENDCRTPDSWLGIGANAEGHSVGNMAIGQYNPDDGERDTRAWAFVYAR
ncbi:MAG: hypothetical protein CMH50_10155 [Myxococcales bacterium]|nr:hypothetical protein [Myxococcales bacterium]